MPDLLRLRRPDGATLAYRRLSGQGPAGVVWLGGFNSDMTGTKATALETMAARRGLAYVRFDYFGHGQSDGAFKDGTITRWRDDALAILDDLTEGPQILVGSSMGAWIAVLAGLARPERVAGLILIAPALDFTEDLLWASLPDDARHAIETQGQWQRPSAYGPDPYPITRTLIEDGRRHLLLRGPILLNRPTRILQGMADPDVPWRHALRLLERLGSADIITTLTRAGDHRLSTPEDLARLDEALGQLLALLPRS